MIHARSRFLSVFAVGALLASIACASSPHVDAYLAVSPDRRDFDDAAPRFTSCESCPQRTRDLPGGRTLSVTISDEPLYSLSPRDIEELAIYEERSPFVRGTNTYAVIATPTGDWLSQTEALRDSYPYDTVAWLESNRLVAVGPNINHRQQGSFAVAAFFCRNQAAEFAAYMKHEPSYITQSESEYETLVGQLNSNYKAALAELRVKPKGAGKGLPEVSPETLKHLLEQGFPELPVEPSVYYGSDYEPLVCE